MARWGKKSRIEITTRNHETGLVTVEYKKNMLMRNALSRIAQSLARIDPPDDEDTYYDLFGIRYLAWGSNDRAVNDGQGYLFGEFGRKAITTSTEVGTGVVRMTTVINADEAVGQIEELGWFGALYATSTTNSGLMVARALWSHTKTDAESVQIDRTDTFIEQDAELWERDSDETTVFPVSPTTLTISGGSITITDTAHILRGEANADDVLDTIITPAGFTGNLLLLESGGSEVITVDAELIRRSNDFVMNSNNDQLLLRCTAANSFKIVSDFTAGS